ncbi:hypothetical protein [Streptomyces sp. SAI-229]|jgi:short-subunit dehydrogenase|uniref:hypothetical protein n=1 Tax=Streptomyces sp. SAI-229 TaxID=3377731 RepID=UPI003C7D5D6E
MEPTSRFGRTRRHAALRREAKAQGVQVVVVRPGGVRTGMAAHSGDVSLGFADRMSPEHQRLHGGPVRSAVASNTAFIKRAMPAGKAGARIAEVATKARPRTR